MWGAMQSMQHFINTFVEFYVNKPFKNVSVLYFIYFFNFNFFLMILPHVTTSWFILVSGLARSLKKIRAGYFWSGLVTFQSCQPCCLVANFLEFPTLCIRVAFMLQDDKEKVTSMIEDGIKNQPTNGTQPVMVDQKA